MNKQVLSPFGTTRAIKTRQTIADAAALDERLASERARALAFNKPSLRALPRARSAGELALVRDRKLGAL